ncbi:MAG: type II secretion system protein GspM [Syntrophales bacterium]|jgi:general secretion pathway protein M|nr:type II secretion system protein GspM [Syntrophales bacterium]MDY0044338.1 type II secretion system protein GspM [Syntrophales bacterium]
MKGIKLKLNKRERYSLIAGISAVTIFIIVQFAIFPFLDSRDQIKRSIAQNKKVLKEISLLAEEYRLIKADSGQMKKMLLQRPSDFTLFSFLEQEAGNAGIKPNITYMKPSDSKIEGPYRESSVEMKLENVTLNQLTEYLHRVESPSDLVAVKRISVKQSKEGSGYLSVVLQMVTYTIGGGMQPPPEIRSQRTE